MSDAAFAPLRWRCRRGMKELDLLLGEWLDKRWPDAAAPRRDAFRWLLDQPDPDIARWLLGGARPDNARHAALVDEIVRLRH